MISSFIYLIKMNIEMSYFRFIKLTVVQNYISKTVNLLILQHLNSKIVFSD